VVRRAEQYLQECGDPSVRIEDLCMAACTSLSRLERAFRETFGVGPRRYLTLRRLAAVRRELLRRGEQTSVTEVATRWGFFHLGRFSQDYKTLFGETPSQTLRHLP
jgi:AraC family ethanolamine operon transcriptional activator